MRYVVSDCLVRVTWPEDKLNRYVEPLATYRGRFFEALNSTIWEVYRPEGRGSGNALAIHNQIHSLVCDLYWSLAWDSYTPVEWIDGLNGILACVATSKIRKPSETEQLRPKVVSAFEASTGKSAVLVRVNTD